MWTYGLSMQILSVWNKKHLVFSSAHRQFKTLEKWNHKTLCFIVLKAFLFYVLLYFFTNHSTPNFVLDMTSYLCTSKSCHKVSFTKDAHKNIIFCAFGTHVQCFRPIKYSLNWESPSTLSVLEMTEIHYWKIRWTQKSLCIIWIILHLMALPI